MPWKIEDFQLGKTLGKGRFGSVYLAKEKKSNYVVGKWFNLVSQNRTTKNNARSWEYKINSALKVLFKTEIREASLQHQVRREVEIQSHIRHKNICRLYSYFHDASRVYIILEYCVNGNLFKKLKVKFLIQEIMNLINF